METWALVRGMGDGNWALVRGKRMDLLVKGRGKGWMEP
jgi:hypothetical protein